MQLPTLTLPAMLAAMALGSAALGMGVDKPDEDVRYQGQLLTNGQAQGGNIVMDIDFYSDDQGNNSLGFISNLPVTLDAQGRFVIDLPGTLFNDGNNVWMGFTIEGVQLSPLQPVTASATSNYSLNTRGLHVSQSSGYVGVGNDDPQNPLHVTGRIRSNGSGAGLTVFNPDNEDASFNLSWLDDVARWRVGGNGPGANGGFDFQRVGNDSLLRVLDNGFVGIGTSSPQRELQRRDGGDARLWLEADTNNSGENDHAQILMTQDGGVISAELGFFDSENDLSIRTDHSGGSPIHLLLEPSGNVGIGISNPESRLDVLATEAPADTTVASAATFAYDGPQAVNSVVNIESHAAGSGQTALHVIQFDTSSSDYGAKVVAVGGTALLAQTAAGGTPLVANKGGPSGDIAVFQYVSNNRARIDSTGKGFFNGGTQTGGADVAEAFEVEGDVSAYEPGDVLVISTKRDRTVTLSAEPYSTLVAGVHATKPGVLLSERHIDESLDDTVPMGVVGVIPTKVCGENGVIRRGDLLVSSSLAGHAMKGTDRLRMIGAIVGKALEDFDPAGSDDTALIRVMVNVK